MMTTETTTTTSRSQAISLIKSSKCVKFKVYLMLGAGCWLPIPQRKLIKLMESAGRMEYTLHIQSACEKPICYVCATSTRCE